MPTPARIIRAEAENLSPPPPRTARQQQRHERIIAVGRTTMANHGPQNITMANFAVGLAICTSTLRRHFPDLHCLLAEIIKRHLLALANALGEIPLETPNRQAHLIKTYFNVTRTPMGGLTEAHLLLTRDLHLLPEDLRTPLEQTQLCIAALLGPDIAREAQALLDTPYLALPRIEAMLAPLQPQTDAQPQPQPQLPPPGP